MHFKIRPVFFLLLFLVAFISEKSYLSEEEMQEGFWKFYSGEHFRDVIHWDDLKIENDYILRNDEKLYRILSAKDVLIKGESRKLTLLYVGENPVHNGKIATYCQK